MHRPGSFLYLATLSVVLAGCGDGSGTTPPPPPPPPAVASVTVSPASPTTTVGTSIALTATALSASGVPISGKTATWSSSNSAVATVATNGVVSAVGAGTATVIATIDGKSGSAVVTVVLPAATSVTVTPTSGTLDLNESLTLTATARDGSNIPIPGKVIAWSSSSPSIATVSQQGTVTGLTEGVAQITATADGASGSATITVRAVVASVVVAPASSALLLGATVQLTATPQSAAGTALPGRNVTWLTSSATVATVSAAGLVTARAVGEATISATSEGKTGTALVTVVTVPVASVTVEPAAATVQTGGSIQLAATPRDNAGNALAGRSITWVSGNAGIATVSTSGRVTGISVGQVTITATSEGQSGTAVITVLRSPVATVTVVPSSESLTVGGTLQLAAVLRSATGDTLTGRTVTWSSKFPGIATVSASGGLVTALSPGIAPITAESEGMTGTAVVVVTQEPPATVSITPAGSAIVAGDILTMVAIPRDAGGNPLAGRTASWFSYNGFVVSSYTSRDTMVVTAITAGTDTVVAVVDGTAGETTVRVTASPVDICTQVAGASVLANDGTYLGRLTNAADPQSVYNPLGTYGSQTSATSIYNSTGQYGSPTSPKSPWNPYGSTPPTLVKNSLTLGTFTLNRLLPQRFSPSFTESCVFPP